MSKEKATDIFIAELLKEADIRYVPEEGINKEVNDALKTASKKGTGKQGFPEFTGQSKDFIIVIEDKANSDKHALYENEENNTLLMDQKTIQSYALNGALHYAQEILNKTNFKKVFAFGCSGDKKHHQITPIFLDEEKYEILPDIENFTNFNEENIERYYKEQILGETLKEIVDKECYIDKAKELHELLRNYGQLGDSEKPLVVSAILLALNQRKRKLIDDLGCDEGETDGEIIYRTLSVHLDKVEVEPGAKKDVILNQFTLIKDRAILNQVDDRLGKTPLKYFTEFIENKFYSFIKESSYEDILGRFYGEFIRYSGGDGQNLGVVLTPHHITNLFCELINLNQDDVVFDPCCGTGGFLLAGMHQMIKEAKDDNDKIKHIKKKQIYGIEVREDMFSIATTNMILRGDGKSNLKRDDFLKLNSKKLQESKYTVGFMNPPYSQRKNKETAHLSEIHFVEHLLNSLDKNARCVVIVPQSTMVGKTKEDKQVKKNILKKHTLEGVITLNPNTFYGIGVNPCIGVFIAHQSHPNGKRSKFINFEDDGYIVSKHVGIIPTVHVEEKKKHLLDCWRDEKDAETKFMVKTKIEGDDEWLHSFYYFNDEIPKHEEFEKTMADYLSFEFNMIISGRKYLFEGD